MSKNERLFSKIKKLLKENPGLSWQSDSSGETIQPVRMRWMDLYDRKGFTLTRWKGEPDKEAEKRLAGQVEAQLEENQPAMQELADLLIGTKSLVSLKRATAVDTEFDLYVLVNFGWRYVGIRVRLIET